MSENIIEMCGISKQFNDILALQNVNFQVKRGEVHALFGENGSGKTVLMKILSGILRPDSGCIKLDGEIVNVSNYQDAQVLGIRKVFQEQVLFPDLSVAENLFIAKLSTEGKKSKIMVNPKKMYSECSEILEGLNFNIPPKSLVKDLALWEKQLLEIAKAVSLKSKVVIMDEPTNLLTNSEIVNIYKIIENLKKQGIAVIYISHRIEEALKVSDRISVIREGQIIKTQSTKEFSRDSLVKLSAGRSFKDRYPKLSVQKGRVFLKIKDLSVNNVVNNVSFALRKGEILGIAGLVGSGRTDIAKAIFGAQASTGEIYLNGTKLNIKCPYDAIKAGIAFISEDRIDEGVIGNFDIPSNITLCNLNGVKNRFFLRNKKEKDAARKYIKKLVIKTPFVEQKVKNLSGGNQQKVALAKWLFSGAKIFIFDEPTLGLDTASKVEVYNIMNEIVLNNSSIILISSDLSELMGMSDRILGIYKGQVVVEMDRKEFSTEKILQHISGENN